MKKHITTLRHNFARFQLHSGDENPNNIVLIDTTTNKVFKVVDILEKYLSNDGDLMAFYLKMFINDEETA